MFNPSQTIAGYDDELFKAMEDERRRQEEHIELIASENYTSPRVLEAQGSVLTNKYAEGYPSKRYYGGCEYVDVAEQLAIDRLKSLFGADYANVQPHSGSQANGAVYMALIQPGDTILGLSLADGGHLTHGAKPNFSGKIYNSVQYGLIPDTGLIDYDQVEALSRTVRGTANRTDEALEELAEITKDTPQTKKFIFDTDPKTGEPSGTVREYAMAHVLQMLPKTPVAQMVPRVKEISESFAQAGFTSLKLAEGRPHHAKAAAMAEAQGNLTNRLFLSWEWESHYNEFTDEEISFRRFPKPQWDKWCRV